MRALKVHLPVLTILTLTFGNGISSEESPRHKVILVSMDGFRHDYLSQVKAPNFQKMIKSGVTMPYINNTFIGHRFRPHFTTVTGRYEESHGILGNNKYNTHFVSGFSFGNVESRWWNGAEPVWNTATKIGLKAGVYCWPGGDVEIQGTRPSKWLPYKSSVPYELRVNTLLQSMFRDNFNLGLLYFDEPYSTGLKYGPGAPETIRVVEKMDSILGLILNGIEESGLKDTVNLIVTSDHRMSSTVALTKNAGLAKKSQHKGDHDYDNGLPTMKPIFLAMGPAFKSGEIVEPIQSVDIYPLICNLLKLEPAPNNGSLQRASTLLKPKVILVSMDGFRYDYLNKAKTPYFSKMLKSGVSMPYLNNTFVTLTFPCHYTIVTGRYDESHGIVGNNMYDPEFKAYFSFSTLESRWWNDAEPVWNRAEKAGLKTGVYFWPGGDIDIQGMRPNKWIPYNESIPFEDRVNVLINWMTEDDFDLGLVYFEEPDHTGHQHGPDAPETMAMVERMDGLLGLLLKGIEESGLKERINLIVTSDHGMANVDTLKRLIDVSDYADPTILLEVVQQGPTAHIRPQPGKERELVAALSKVPHMTVMLKEDIPERFHYKNHRRVPAVIAIAEEGWQITQNASVKKMNPMLGDHGYDNDILAMKPIFIAMGPAFKSGEIVESIKSVDIYPLICHLLNIEPSANNGSLQRASTLLRPVTFPHAISASQSSRLP